MHHQCKAVLLLTAVGDSTKRRNVTKTAAGNCLFDLGNIAPDAFCVSGSDVQYSTLFSGDTFPGSLLIAMNLWLMLS